jgi:hypothetical protein
MVLLGGHNIESQEGFLICSDPDGGLTEGELTIGGEGSGDEPLETFCLSGLTGVS